MIELLKIVHLCSLFALVALTGIAAATPFAASLATLRKPILMWAGIASLLVFVTGSALLGIEKLGWPMWAVVKTICWLLLSAIGGIMLRKPHTARTFTIAGGLAVVVALAMVFFKPVL